MARRLGELKMNRTRAFNVRVEITRVERGLYMTKACPRGADKYSKRCGEGVGRTVKASVSNGLRAMANKFGKAGGF